MKYKDLIYTLYCDFYRQTGKELTRRELIKYIFSISTEPGFKYILLMRICKYFHVRKKNIIAKVLLKILKYKFRRLQYKYGIDIPYTTEIKEGFLISHFTGIVVNSHAKIGRNCSILQGVTIGNNLYKSRNDVATIGDNVFIGAGAKIVGPVIIGNNVTIGANAVVVKDIPDNSVVAGNPSIIISEKKSIDINREYKTKSEFLLSKGKLKGKNEIEEVVLNDD